MGVQIGLVGSEGCGKTATIVAYMLDEFVTEHTEGIEDVYVRKMDTGKEVPEDVRIIDFCGCAQFYQDHVPEMQRCDVFLLLFSLADGDSFHDLDSQHLRIQQFSSSLTTVLVGTHRDAPVREVSADDAIEWAQSHSMTYIEVSAREKFAGVEDAFTEALKAWQRATGLLGDGCIRGHLLKEGGGRFGQKHKRWFKLGNQHLTYWEHEKDEAKGKPIGSLDLTDATVTSVKDTKEFRLEGPSLNKEKKNKTYVLHAATDEEFFKWKRAFEQETRF
eukprot:TRINITY_DN104521_c0_g1_i1.p1 TRINITY_DN104521_c0_g1~~TRINITY_DN104521_c0_g1_i1.p1  ORF type:complete len:275 (-),score=32.84 TRINITY_DN104521_c0_g1_i1:754-1578(-)